MADLAEVKSQLEAPSVTAEAVFRTTTPSEGAQRLKDRKAEKGPMEFLESYNQNKPFETGHGTESLNRMGMERDASTGKKNRTGEELRRYNEAKSSTELIERYLEKGPDSLVPGSSEETKVIEYFKRAIALWPETENMTDQERVAYIKKRLGEPKFIARVKTAYDSELKKSEAFDETIQQKEEAYRKAERERVAKEREQAKNTTDLGENTASLALYGETNGQPNAKQKILNDAITDSEQAKVELQNIDDQIAQKNVEYLRKKAERDGYGRNTQQYADANREMGTLQADIASFEMQKSQHSRKIAIANQLQAEYEALKASKTKLEEDKYRIEGELDGAKYEETKRRAVYEDARNTREGQEKQFVDGLQRVFYNAALEDISEQVRENEEFRREELNKVKEQIGDQASKTILEGIKEKWVRIERDGTKIKKIELQKGEIEQDYYRLLTEGPKGMLREMLQNAKDSNGNPIFSDTEIELKINVPGFVAGAENEFITSLLRKRLQTAKITQGEANLLFDRFGDKVADVALNKNNAAGGMIDRLKDKNGFKGSRKEFLKKMVREPKTYGGMLAILALLLGSPFLIAGGAVAGGLYAEAVKAVA